MIKTFRDTNRYLIILIVGIISFLNSDLYFGDLVQQESQHLIDGINSITKCLVIILIFLLLSIFPMTKTIKNCIRKCFFPIIWIYKKIKSIEFDFDSNAAERMFVSLNSYVAYIILLVALITFAFLL